MVAGPPRRVGLIRVGILACVLLVAASCGVAPAGPQPTPGVPARSLGGVAMSVCTFGGALARCGALPVPVDRGRVDSRTIDLNIVVVPAKEGSTRSALFLLAGGPGGSATAQYGWAVQAFAGLRSSHDFVLVDQRGTGGSDQLRLPPQPDASAYSATELPGVIKRWAEPAFAALPNDVVFYTTRAAADDLDAVRGALGYERIDVLGVSYGATVAQYYMRQYPERVRTVVLDGATLVHVPIMERVALNVQRAFDALVARCAADSGCNAAYPAIAAEVESLFARLRERPVALTTPQGTRSLDDLALASAIQSALLNHETAAQLPYLLHLAYRDRWDELVRALPSSPQDESLELAMSLVIRCAEPWARFDPAEIARVAPASFDTAVQVRWATIQSAVCAYVPKGRIAPGEELPVRSDAPVLLLVGGADPQDPFENVADAPALFPNSQIVVVPGHGHSVTHLGCVGDVVARFVKAGTATHIDSSCITSGGVPLAPFRVP
jgi:pimeloyl-ACP methyl ester carboxylesterase